ncbi:MULTISPECIES: peptidoglycan D,D-transpeptidase FtsI family protein [Cysteiniphilum]|uniref:Peptidoglycan D,D-transpeptidase FtsI n=1 Tax=Cysteiniphilum litorale TaxID=2056700 RepID=A0A8J3E838_9GAMM|nr:MULTISPECIES: penicillin-binding protein 2 [Cysteiniphilum]GGF90706.1 cell division protein [Cysteiniphilum litorale]
MRKIKLSWRYYFILLVIVCVLGLLVYKLTHMQTVEYAKLKKEGDNRSERTLTTTAYRGMISDRNGKPLAISTPVDSIWVNPFYITSDDPGLRKILNLLELDKAQQDAIIARIKAREGRHGFVYLKRQVSPFIAQKIKTLDVKGVKIEREFKRFYPDTEVMAHVVGFTNIDDQGQEGIELEYNKYLTGKDGTRSIHKDLKGGVARKNDDDTEVKHGADISLSIDRKLQYIAYKYIKEGVINNHAEAGSAIVMDVKTGEVLAMVNYPSYNPNNMQDATPEKRRNRVLTDVYEPGSVIKPFAAIAGMESGQYDVDTIVDTSPGFYKLNGRTVRDFRNYGEMDLRHILMKSSNVGISRIILSIDANALGDTLRKFGFGQVTKIGFPGERSGYVPSPRKWGEFPLATLSFGYGMNATALQIATAYSAIANGGKLIPPTLLKRNKKEDVEAFQIINSEIAEKVVDMLTSVVEGLGGTASKARVPRYHVAGKTGTVRKAIAGGYASDSYMATFVGIAPSSNPRIVTVVVIDDPKGEAYGGGSAAAPIFAQITEHILRVMGVPADKLKKA